MTRLRRTILATLAVAARGLLGACTSQPSAKDVVESPDLSATEQTSVLDVLDDMTNDELGELGEDNVGVPNTDCEPGNADMQAFADLTAFGDAG